MNKMNMGIVLISMTAAHVFSMDNEGVSEKRKKRPSDAAEVYVVNPRAQKKARVDNSPVVLLNDEEMKNFAQDCDSGSFKTQLQEECNRLKSLPHLTVHEQEQLHSNQDLLDLLNHYENSDEENLLAVFFKKQ